MAKKEEGEIVEAPKRELILEGDPEQQLAFAHKAAKALMGWVSQKPKPVMIRGEQFLEFGDWQIIGRFYGSTVGVEWTKELANGKGYEARAVVYRNGEIISAAEAMCTRDERNWKERDEFMLKSMAQTRASAKALRQAFGWVAELAGFKATPAEEMGDLYDKSTPTRVVPVVVGTDTDMAPHRTNPPRVVRDEKKMRIVALLNEGRVVPLETKQEFEEACEEATGLKLIVSNFDLIITRLEAMR